LTVAYAERPPPTAVTLIAAAAGVRFSGAVKVRENFEAVTGRDWGDSAAVIPDGTDSTLRLSGVSVRILVKPKLTVTLWPLLSVMLVVGGEITMCGVGSDVGCCGTIGCPG
jgi:hypothetical protein